MPTASSEENMDKPVHRWHDGISVYHPHSTTRGGGPTITVGGKKMKKMCIVIQHLAKPVSKQAGHYSERIV